MTHFAPSAYPIPPVSFDVIKPSLRLAATSLLQQNGILRQGRLCTLFSSQSPSHTRRAYLIVANGLSINRGPALFGITGVFPLRAAPPAARSRNSFPYRSPAIPTGPAHHLPSFLQPTRGYCYSSSVRWPRRSCLLSDLCFVLREFERRTVSFEVIQRRRVRSYRFIIIIISGRIMIRAL